MLQESANPVTTTGLFKISIELKEIKRHRNDAKKYRLKRNVFEATLHTYVLINKPIATGHREERMAPSYLSMPQRVQCG
jgi:hypothetical protein